MRYKPAYWIGTFVVCFTLGVLAASYTQAARERRDQCERACKDKRERAQQTTFEAPATENQNPSARGLPVRLTT